MTGFAVHAVFELAGDAVIFATAAWLVRRLRKRPLWGSWAIAIAGLAAWFAARGWPDAAVSSGATAAFCAWMWYRRRRRDRAARSYGAKSKALIAGLVRRAREAARPRPVLRPVPQGARA